MNDRPFADKKDKPESKALASVLRAAFPLYEKLRSLTATFKHEWNHSARSGWMEKVHDGKKALYYCLPLRDAFTISLTVREAERKSMLADANMKPFHASLRAAKRYAEGYLMRFTVDSKDTFAGCEKFLGKLIAARR